MTKGATNGSRTAGDTRSTVRGVLSEASVKPPFDPRLAGKSIWHDFWHTR